MCNNKDSSFKKCLRTYAFANVYAVHKARAQTLRRNAFVCKRQTIKDYKLIEIIQLQNII